MAILRSYTKGKGVWITNPVGLSMETFTTYAHPARLPSRSTYCQYPQADYPQQVEDPLCGQRQ